MKKQGSRRVNQTFSLPLDISQELHMYVKSREMSQFVSDAIRKELAHKKELLKQAYLSLNQDEGQKEAMNEWKTTLEDGSNEW
ncbi:MAG: hypothetical protein KBC64_00510 [Simkaniaceae bacterium]|nr:hypothetical protein [Simkaniaceae bacterium]